MSDTGSSSSAAAQDRTARDAVVRPLARAAQRACVRPGCPSPARASLSFRYGSREAWLERLTEEPRPESYDLCSSHAARTRPPHGWQLRDRRPREEQVDGEPPTTPDHLGGEQTVAVLAAALRSVPAGDELPADDELPAAEVPADDELPAAEVPAADQVSSPGEETPPDPAPPAIPTPAAPGAGRLEDSTSPALEPPRPDPASADTQPQPQPRPVPAARERWAESGGGDTAPNGPARHW